MKYEEMKTICSSILSEEIKKNNLKTTSYVFGKLTYYNSGYFRQKLVNSVSTSSDKKYNKFTTLIKQIKNIPEMLETIEAPFRCRAFYSNGDDTIVIFIKSYDKIKYLYPINVYAKVFFGKETNITNLLISTYHELYHAIDWSNSNGFDISSYDQFACDIERVTGRIVSSDWEYLKKRQKYMLDSKYHDSFMYEILANKYAVMKTEEFIKQNPTTYDYDYTLLNREKQKCLELYNNYNLSDNLDIIISNYKMLLEQIPNFDKRLFEIFLNDDGTFKDIRNCITNERLLSIDERILKAFYNTTLFKTAVQQQMCNTTNLQIESNVNDYSQRRR